MAAKEAAAKEAAAEEAAVDRAIVEEAIVEVPVPAAPEVSHAPPNKEAATGTAEEAVMATAAPRGSHPEEFPVEAEVFMAAAETESVAYEADLLCRGLIPLRGLRGWDEQRAEAPPQLAAGAPAVSAAAAVPAEGAAGAAPAPVAVPAAVPVPAAPMGAVPAAGKRQRQQACAELESVSELADAEIEEILNKIERLRGREVSTAFEKRFMSKILAKARAVNRESIGLPGGPNVEKQPLGWDGKTAGLDAEALPANMAAPWLKGPPQLTRLPTQ